MNTHKFGWWLFGCVLPMKILSCFAILVVTSLTNMRIWLEKNIINQYLYIIYTIFIYYIYILHNLIEKRTDNKWFPPARNGDPRNRENIAAILCNCLGFPVSIVIIVVMVLTSRKKSIFQHKASFNLKSTATKKSQKILFPDELR